MSELDDIRIKISETDKELARLFERRINLAQQVIDYKVRSGLSILDADQESRVIDRNINNVSDPELKEYYVLFLKRVMEISRAYQLRKMNCMRVSYAGQPGTFAYEASKKLFPNAQLIPCYDFESAYITCEEGNSDVTILPIDNNFIGDSGNVIDLTFSGSLFVNMMLDFSVNSFLFGLPGAKINQITRVLVHPHIKSQVMDYILAHNFEVIEFDDIANAARELLDQNDATTGLISLDSSLSCKGFEILENKISVLDDSSIRYAVFSRILNVPSEQRNLNEHFILVFTVRNQAGALAKALNIIGSHGFNMSNLRSRPIKNLVWNYFFFVELEGYLGVQEREDLFRQLNTVCDKLKLVGYYKRVKL